MDLLFNERDVSVWLSYSMVDPDYTFQIILDLTWQLIQDPSYISLHNKGVQEFSSSGL